jgi:hypothetical protein
MLWPWLLLLTTPAGYHSAGPRANRRAPQSAVPRGFAGVYGGTLLQLLQTTHALSCAQRNGRQGVCYDNSARIDAA